MQPRIEPLGSSSRVDGVTTRLRELILSGELPAGDRLPNERELAESLGVNRSSVREALKRLEFLELIEVRHGQGSFVRALSESSALQVIDALLADPRTVTVELLRQLLEFRRHISLHVVELAAKNQTAAQRERAEALLARELGAGSDASRALSLDVEMNALLGEATGNLMYQLLSNMFTKLIERLGPIYYNESRDHERSREIHVQLLAALARRDAAAARSVLEEMLDYSEASILAEASRQEEQGLIGPAARGVAR
ncbi:MAG: GntR family transcriptional regulator [Deltaproteobacteria bacterium]|nr:GntR family transcriptional regulator [Deltaproteobacteria bacterium]